MSDQHNLLTPARSADLTGTACPATFLRAKLILDSLPEGEVLEIVLRRGDQMQSVPKSLKEEGHRIERVRQEADGYHVFVRKGLQ